MRIGLACHASVGGSVRIAISLANSLIGRGHEVHLFIPYADEHRSLFDPGLTLHTLDSHFDRQPPEAGLYVDWSDIQRGAFQQLLEAACDEQVFDILHFHYAVPFAELFAGLRQKPGGHRPAMLGTLHGTDVLVYARDRGQGPGIRSALMAMDCLTTVSNAHAELTQTLYALAEDPRVIPNFVNPAQWRPGLPRRHAADGPWRLVHLSNFRPIKSVLDVGRIFAALTTNYDVELSLLGDGPDHDRLLEYARGGGSAEKVHDIGLVHDPARYLRGSDLMLITSGYESFCMAALEAMACGVPVLAPAVGGLPELVRDQLDGLLYEPGNIDQAIDLASELLANPAKHEAMALSAIDRSTAFFDDRIVPLYEDLYRSLINQ